MAIPANVGLLGNTVEMAGALAIALRACLVKWVRPSRRPVYARRESDQHRIRPCWLACRLVHHPSLQRKWSYMTRVKDTNRSNVRCIELSKKMSLHARLNTHMNTPKVCHLYQPLLKRTVPAFQVPKA